MLAMEQGVDLLLEVGIDCLRKKSVCQTEYLIDLFDHYLALLGFELGTPQQSEMRGSHVGIYHPEGYRVNRLLIEDFQVIPDFRAPEIILMACYLNTGASAFRIEGCNGIVTYNNP